MKQREYHVGPGAVSLLLIIVVVSMSVLGLLSLISARGDYRLTERARDFAVAERAVSAAAERSLAELDGIFAVCAKDAADDAAYEAAVRGMLPEGVSMTGRSIRWEETASGGRVLSCVVELLPLGSEKRYAWSEHTFEAAASGDYEKMNFDIWE